MTHGDQRFAVVGAGASGIAAAFYLRERGIDVQLIEQADRIGGRMGAVRVGDQWIEVGGTNVGKRAHLFREFARKVGDNPFDHHDFGTSLVRDGRLLEIGREKRLRTLWTVFAEASFSDAVRFVKLAAAVKRQSENGYLGSAYFDELGRKYDSKSVAEYFSPKFLRAVLRPLTVLGNGAEPDEMYMGNIGTNLGMLLDDYDVLRFGTGRLLEQFTRAVPVRLRTQVKGLLWERGRVSGLRMVNDSGTVEECRYDGVVVTTPSPLAADIVAENSRDLAARLRLVRYFPSLVIVAEYARNIFGAETRAIAFDESSALGHVSAYGRARRNLVRYTFSGRAARNAIARGASAEEMLHRGEESVSEHVPVSERARVSFTAFEHRLGHCAYVPFFADFERALHADLRKLPGLYLTGDYLRGASIGACFLSAHQCVSAIVAARATPRAARGTARTSAVPSVAGATS